MRRLTIIESPFAGDIARNQAYLRRCLRDSWSGDELPYASHGFFPQFLDENDPEERSNGIAAGYDMWQFACRVAFYLDYGLSPGMKAAQDYLDKWNSEYLATERRHFLLTSIRYIGKEP